MKPSPSRQTVLEAIGILHENGHDATRHSIADLSGMPLVTVDDTLKRLHNDGEIQRVARGRYAPAPPIRPFRAVRWGCGADGLWFIEAGSERIGLDMDSTHALVRSEGDGTILYTLGGQSIELTADEDRRAGILRQAAVLAAGGADWCDAFESPARRAERTLEALRMVRRR